MRSLFFVGIYYKIRFGDMRGKVPNQKYSWGVMMVMMVGCYLC